MARVYHARPSAHGGRTRVVRARYARDTRPMSGPGRSIFIGTGACAALLAVGHLAPAYADRIVAISVEENTKTTDATVALIADIAVGDEWTPGLADEVEQRLESAGLFKELDVYWDDVPASGTRAGGVRVHIVARDKHSWIIAPTAYNQPTNKGVGLGFAENNLAGENKKLLLYGQVATGDSFLVGAYVDPSIAGSRFHWQPDVFLKTSRVIEYASPTAWRDDPDALRQTRLNYLNAGVRAGVNIWKLSLDGRLRAAHVSYGKIELANPDVDPSRITGEPGLPGEMLAPPGPEGWDVSTEWTLGYDSRATWHGVSQGTRLSARYEVALPGLGSDFTYSYASFSGDRAIRFFERHNLVLKGQFQLGRNLPFQQEFTAGGTSMRGWKNGQFRGDFKVQANVEYSVPLFSISGLSFRGQAFWDSSYVTFRRADEPATGRDYLPEARARGLDPFKNSVGLGLRLHLRQIVLPLLGVDFGYGLERNAFELYLAIGLSD